MKKLLAALFFSLLLLSACSTTPDNILNASEQANEKKKAENCIEHPELADQWGECNVQSKIREKIPSIKSCYEKTLKANEALSGELMLKIKLWKSGAVRLVVVQEASLKNKLVSNCLIAEIRKIKFAKPPKGHDPVIYMPFSLDTVK